MKLLDQYYESVQIVSKLGFNNVVEAFLLKALNSFSQIRKCRNENHDLLNKCNIYANETKNILRVHYMSNGFKCKLSRLDDKYKTRLTILG